MIKKQNKLTPKNYDFGNLAKATLYQIEFPFYLHIIRIFKWDAFEWSSPQNNSKER